MTDITQWLEDLLKPLPPGTVILNAPDTEDGEGGESIQYSLELLESDLVQATHQTLTSPYWTERCATHLGNTSFNNVAYSVWQFHSVDSMIEFNSACPIVPKSLWL